MSSSMAFAWSISGVVKSGSGRALADVKINSFNYSGIEATTDATGAFSISGEGSDAIFGARMANMSVHMDGNVLNIDNINAGTLKISVIDALGKVLKQNNLVQIYGFVSIDLGKLAKGAKFIRITADRQNSTYMLTNKGVTALKKEGDVLPTFNFMLDGYQSVTYQMVQEVETDVVITMQRGSTTTSSSSTINPIGSSSSVETQQSSSSQKVDDTPVDCSGKNTLQAGQNHTIKLSNGREYIVHIPENYKGDKPVPMLVDFHPVYGSGSNWAGSATYQKQTDADGAIVIYPDGGPVGDPLNPNGGNNGGGMGGMFGGMGGHAWNVGPCCSTTDDITFTKEFVKDVQTKVCIDKKRIYATGFSMGGGMSNFVSCELADIFAAAAPAAMDLAKEYTDGKIPGKEKGCVPARPISILNFRNTNDGTVKYDGGPDSMIGPTITFLGAKNNFKFWAEKNGCTGEPKQNTPANGCEMYENCKDGVKVGLCTGNGGHSAGDPNVGWPFLKQFSLP